MKNSVIVLLVCFSVGLNAQKNWFETYSDSVALVKDAKEITQKFTADIHKIDPKLPYSVGVVLNTTPYFIFYDREKANIPLWSQMQPEHKALFYELTGSEKAGVEAFGLFFNGFYLPHELAHGFQDKVQGEQDVSYDNEYFANTVAILWWRKQHRENDLKKCYEFAKLMVVKLPNPVPEGKTVAQYFTENYREATQNPKTYGYMQWNQFIEIYENKTLPDFDAFVKDYLKKNLKN